MNNLNSTLAYQLQQDTEGIRNTLTQYNLEMGQTMLMVKRNESYKLLDYDTFESYLAAHRLSQYAVDRAMRAVKFFCEEHKIPAEDLIEIGMTNLDEARKAIQIEPDKMDEWLLRASELSPSDMINAVRQLKGRPPLQPKEKQSHVGAITSFRDWVRGQPCCVCGCPPRSQYAHWPVREKWRKVGGKFGIPLCATCHDEMDKVQGYVSFFDHYRAQIGEFLEKVLDEYANGD